MRYLVTCILGILVAFNSLAQTTASLTLNSNTQGTKIARDEIKMTTVGGPGGHLVTNTSTNIDGHLYLDKSVQLAASYMSSPPTVSTVRTLDQNLKPGTIIGNHSVDLSGGFNYSIPIQLPPGTNNMAPALGLSYNSNSRETHMGIGWGISGLSVISRIPKDLFHDQGRNVIEFNITGPFALDGNRLAYQGTNANGENYFYTESETFSMITLKNQNTPTQYFEVKTKSGLTMIYGNTTDSKAELPFVGRTLPTCGAVTLWYLNKVIDNYGNYIEYSYLNSGSTTEGSDVAIKEIKYTGNQNAGITPYTTIRFYYDIRSDQHRQYLFGDVITRKLVLREISVYSGALFLTPVLNYRFKYSHTDLNYLSEVILSGMNGDRLNSTAFVYGANKPSQHVTTLSNLPTSLPLNADYSSADLNGDGKSDLVAFLYNSTNVSSVTGAKVYEQWKMYLNNGNGFTSSEDQSVTESPRFLPLGSPNDIFMGVTAAKGGFLLADVSGDPAAEIIYSKNVNGTFADIVAYSFDASTSQMQKLNLPVSSYPAGYTIRTPNTMAGQELATAFGDFDGNAKSELIYFWTDRVSDYNLKYIDFQNNVTIFHSPGSSPISVTDINNTSQSLMNYANFIGYDYDGDGRTDLVGYKNIGLIQQFVVIKVTVSGSSISLKEIVSSNAYIFTHSYFGDYNGDGYGDYVRHGPSSLSLIENIGSGFNGSNAIGGNTISGHGLNIYHKILPMDINLDGKTDLLELINSSGGLTLNACYGSRFHEGFVNLGTIPSFYLPHLGNDEIDASGDRDYNGIPGDIGDAYSTDPDHIPMITTGDFNGDGYPDILIKTEQTGINKINIIYLNYQSDEKFITNIYDGNNNELKITYSTLAALKGYNYFRSPGATPHPDLINPTPAMHVVFSINVDNGRGMVDEYEYHNLLRHTRGKGLLGFDKIVKKHYDPVSSDNFQTTSSYDLDLTYFVRKPSITKQEFLSPGGNRVFSTTTYLSNIYGYSTLSTSRYFPEVTSISTVDQYLNSTTNKTFSYDYANGNILSETTDIGPGKEVTQITYSDFVNAGSWINNAAKTQLISITRAGESTFIRKRAFTYDLSKGSLLTTSEEPSSVKEVLKTNIYDQNVGVLLSVTATAPNDNLTPIPVTKSFDYDSKFRFVEKTSSDLGYVSECKYEPVFGRMIYFKDVDGLITKYQFDNFGALSETQAPDGSITKYYSEWFNTGYNDPLDPKQVSASDAMFVNKVQYPDGKVEVSILDRYHRLLKTQTNTFNNGKIANLISYNAKGEIEKEFGPYIVPLPNGKAILETTTSYAPDLGFVVSQNVTDGSVTLNSGNSYNFNTGNKELTIIRTLPDGKTKKETTDETGRLIKVVDNNSGVLEYEEHYDGTYFSHITKLNGTAVQTSKTDNFNQLVEETEPNSGSKFYTINSFGQLKKMVDNKGTQYLFDYDVLGRLTSKSIGSDYYTYKYNDAGFGKGLIDEISLNGTSYKHTYDNFNRLKRFEENLDGKTYVTHYEYDDLSRVSRQIYPNNFSIVNEYSGGSLTKITNGQDNTVIWELNELDNSGAVAKYTLGNTIQTVQNFDNFGYATGTQAGAIQDLAYNFNVLNGNLSSLTNNLTGNLESYSYDNLNRLITINNSQYGGNISTTYDGAGNISTKYDADAYTYHGTKSNQVLTAKNSNAEISTSIQDVNYNLFDKATYIQEGNRSVDIFYGPDKQRYKTVFRTNSLITNTRYYLSGMERNIGSNNTITDVNYVKAPTGICAIQVTSANANSDMYYTYTDHLGSIVEATDKNGNLVASQNFDAWGRRRDPVTHSYSGITSIPDWLSRGYTGHEMLPEFTLINMNGRLYDPILGRMLSVDPVLSDATNSQAYNKYSYVLNNPLKYADPTGQFGVEHLALALFVAGDIIGNSLDYAMNKESPMRQGSYGETLGYSVAHGYYAYNQCMGMFSAPIYNDQSGNSTYGIDANITFGSSGLGVGLTAHYNYKYEFKNGTYLNVGAAVGTSMKENGPSLVGTQSTFGGGFEYGTENFHAGLYTTQFFSGGSSQRVGGLSLGGQISGVPWSANYENDGAIPFKQTRLGDGGDEYRTAALRLKVGDVALGFNLMTERRNSRLNTQTGKVEYETNKGWFASGEKGDKGLHNTQTYITKPSGRLGGLYVGYGNNYVGFNNDAVRDAIQNDAIHKRSFIDSPLFINYNYGTSYYGGTWRTKPYTLW